PTIKGRGKLGGGIQPSHRAERFLVALPTSGDLFICAKDLFVGSQAPRHGGSDVQNLRRPTLTEAFPDSAKSTFPDACLLRFRISRLARPDHGGVLLCTEWVRTDAMTEVVLRLAASDPPSSTFCRDRHCKWVSPNDDGGNSESKDELFHQIPPMSISMSIRSTCYLHCRLDRNVHCWGRNKSGAVHGCTGLTGMTLYFGTTVC